MIPVSLLVKVKLFRSRKTDVHMLKGLYIQTLHLAADNQKPPQPLFISLQNENVVISMLSFFQITFLKLLRTCESDEKHYYIAEHCCKNVFQIA